MTPPTPPAARNASSRAGRPGELARRLSAETHISYQQALHTVRQASGEGRLPERLDGAGVDLALRILLGQEIGQWAPGLLGAPWPARYRPLMATLPGVRTERGREMLARATVAPRPGDVYEIDSGCYGSEYLALEIGARRGKVHRMPHGIERDVLGWLLDCLDARLADQPPQVCLPARSSGSRVDAANALARRGETARAKTVLKRAVEADPWDIDAYAHLGILAIMHHDGLAYGDAPPPAASRAERACLLEEALGWFEAAVCVGEALLPQSFTGLLPRDDAANNWFHRAVGGLAHTLWRLGRFNAAEHTLLSMLYTNPLDGYGARHLLPPVRSGERWTPDPVEG